MKKFCVVILEFSFTFKYKNLSKNYIKISSAHYTELEFEEFLDVPAVESVMVDVTVVLGVALLLYLRKYDMCNPCSHRKKREWEIIS